ncbi:TRAM domain-containing protein [Nocardia sp. NPDC051030]|uniref:class I SAM-dependent RNA methyltransferase n=1 Tax=Nocardia sp. NPDC051030 TaxID=3155162 RepID=UPI0034155689
MSSHTGSDWLGSVFEVRLGPPGHGGFCVARHEGRVLFVRHGLPGEFVRAVVTEDRGSFCRADAVEILEPSADRIPATCQVSGPGGAGCCDFSFATPEAQRALKASVVSEQLRRLADWEPEFVVEAIPAGLVRPSGLVTPRGTHASAHTPGRLGGVATGWPAHLRGTPPQDDAARTATITSDTATRGTRTGADADTAASGAGSETRAAVRDAQVNAAAAGRGSRTEAMSPSAGAAADAVVADAPTSGWRSRVRLVVDAHGNAGVHRYRSTEVIADLRCPQPMAGAMEGIGERTWTPGADLVVAVDGDGMRHIVELAPPEEGHGSGRDRSGGREGRRGADRRSTTARRAAAHRARVERVVDGTGQPVQYVSGRRWELSATGFWQPHYGAAQRYSDVVAEWSDAAPGGLAWDLYCGVGVFAARLADQVGQTGAVHGVESARTAVAEGRIALTDQPWVDLSAERVEHWIAEQPATSPDVVVLDPPRAGAGKDVINALTERNPGRIIHIGCDPASFARDIGLYRAAGYQPSKLRVFDAFPGTHHVECIALLER